MDYYSTRPWCRKNADSSVSVSASQANKDGSIAMRLGWTPKTAAFHSSSDAPLLLGCDSIIPHMLTWGVGRGYQNRKTYKIWQMSQGLQIIQTIISIRP